MRLRTIDFEDMWVRGELNRSEQGRRALEHWAAAAVARTSRARRSHRRIADRLARLALGA